MIFQTAPFSAGELGFRRIGDFNDSNNGLKGQLKGNTEYTICHRISDKWRSILKLSLVPLLDVPPQPPPSVENQR